MMFQVTNESNYEGGTSLILIKTRWTKNLSFDIENARLERIYIFNTNVDPEVKIGVRVRSYGLAPLSPWLLMGLFLSIAGIILFVKKDRE